MVLRFFLLAVLFLFLSCTSFERDNPYDPGGVNYDGSSHSVKYGDTIYYENEAYATVIIGKQTWFQRNLNYDVSGSKCGNGSSPCTYYGRLYNWATAMALDAGCNSSSCASKIKSKHQGICPENWHIPSDAEWTTLTNYVGGAFTAGKYLKAENGWNSGNGNNKYGFSALPGGLYSDGSYYVGTKGYWWSATENGASHAYYRSMLYYDDDVGRDSYNKGNFLLSVRCVKD